MEGIDTNLKKEMSQNVSSSLIMNLSQMQYNINKDSTQLVKDFFTITRLSQEQGVLCKDIIFTLEDMKAQIEATIEKIEFWSVN